MYYHLKIFFILKMEFAMFSVKIKKAIVSDGSRHFEGGGAVNRDGVWGCIGDLSESRATSWWQSPLKLLNSYKIRRIYFSVFGHISMKEKWNI